MTPDLFFKTYSPAAIDAQQVFGVPASITLAQAALESGWGESGLTKKANNFFGIKDFPNDDWAGANYIAYTGEQNANGSYYTIQAPFRKYATPTESFVDHGKFLTKNKNYAPLFKLSQTDYKGWANGLHTAGYATALNYAPTLIGLIDKYNLTVYDTQSSKKKIIRAIGIIALIAAVASGILFSTKAFRGSTKTTKVITFILILFVGIVSYYSYELYKKNKALGYRGIGNILLPNSEINA